MTAADPTDEPPPASTRAERHGQTLAKILATAMETVVTRGFAALSMNKLAAEVGFTPGALYRYFTGKDAVVAALVVDVVGDVGERIAYAISDHGDAENDPIGALTRAAWVWRDYARQHPHRFGLIAAVLATPQLVIEDETHAMRSIAVTLAALAPIGGCFERAATLGLLAPGDPRERTLLFFAGLHGVLSLRKQAERAPDQLDLDHLYRAMLATLFAGLGLRPDPHHENLR